ncbi:MAG: hypothetical protein HY725_19655, partial [Candidatus Rokubacteria bacterium]|nr:hypothetical protein [Candidatus Rokubacteria bacterium]
VQHAVERCAGCGRSLAHQAPDRVERRQVFDLPEPKRAVTEHQGEVKTCACGCVTRAAFPAEAAAPVQYGPRLKSVAVYQRIVDVGYAQNPVADPPPGPQRRGRRKQSKARNLLDRFRDHADGILAFMRDFSVPFDNNLSYAARGIRQIMPTSGLCRAAAQKCPVTGDFSYSLCIRSA